MTATGTCDNMSEFRRYERELSRCRMTPDDINAYVNAACSLSGMLEMLMLDVREQLKKEGRYRHLCKQNVNKILDRCTSVVDNSERCTDEETWLQHAGDISVFHQLFVREGLNLETRIRLVQETAMLAVELLEKVMSALNTIYLSSPIARHVHAKMFGIISLVKEIRVVKEPPYTQWESMHEDLRHIFQELMANRPKEKAAV